MIEFTLPYPTPTLNHWQRWHWRKRSLYTSKLAFEIHSIFRSLDLYPDQPIQKCRVNIERHSTQKPDWDGLYGGVKPLLDCLVVNTKSNPHGLNIIVDDNPDVIVSLDIVPVICKRKDWCTVVRITEIEP